jgi:TnpA family transposase
MPGIQETAYPRLRSQPSPRELVEVYTPTDVEIALAKRVTKGEKARLGFLVLLKTFQRLGYFIPATEAAESIVAHIAEGAGLPATDLAGYDFSGTSRRHRQQIREHLRIGAYGREARRVMVETMTWAARTKDEPADLINAAIEELIRRRWELPVFNTLQRAALHVRAAVSRGYYREITFALSGEAVLQINRLFQTDAATRQSIWNDLRQDVGYASLSNFRDLVAYFQWLAPEAAKVRSSLAGAPDVKIKHFAAEARTLDAGRMLTLEPRKRYALAACCLVAQTAQTLDDLGGIFIRRLRRIHIRGQEALLVHRQAQQEQADDLIGTLRNLVLAYHSEGTANERLAAVGEAIGDRGPALLEQCEAHQALAGNNYYPLLWRFYVSHRATLFRLLSVLEFESTSQDQSLMKALALLRQNESYRGEWLLLETDNDLDLSWASDAVWKLMTGDARRDRPLQRINRRYFEIGVFSHLAQELNSGDACIPGSDQYADYRQQLISWEEYKETIDDFGVQVGRAVENAAFVEQTREWLERIAAQTDEAFPDNTGVRIENGEPVISRLERQPDLEQLQTLWNLIAERIDHVSILDVLMDSERWLNWTRLLGPISGHDAKLEEPGPRYVMTTFCYGCGFGPSQAARALKVIDRRQLAWIHQRHVTEERLDQINVLLINEFNRFELPRRWGSGKSASADGTKWDLYERNLLSEYHIRYGGYGGLGYYHVSDTYVALFSHFIPCGVWEAVYILDGLLKNKSEIQPDTIHADTQGQTATVFGLSFLLGINLMPRIRNWKDLRLSRPSRESRYQHIDELFSESVDWELISTHLADMLRVALSIKAGKITPSTILRKLTTASRKNKLYFAFRELGRAVRTGFLLNYISDAELRATIQAATNKSESFNNFIKWLYFGSLGVIAENDRGEQRKIIKYNHVVANCLILYNVQALTRLLRQLSLEGQDCKDETLGRLSPYLTEHVNRFGSYTLDLNRNTPAPDYNLTLKAAGKG